MDFRKIATQMFPVERIVRIDRQAIIDGQTGVEVFLAGVPDSFTYTGQYASLAFDVLEGAVEPTTPLVNSGSLPAVSVVINGQVTSAVVQTIDGQVFDTRRLTIAGVTFDVNSIVWVDFAASINGQQGVELQLDTNAIGITTQFTGNAASEAYDKLAALATNQQVATA